MSLNRDTSPLVSVIIPTYNRAHLLGRSIQSVLEQTYRNIEVIVVDDASTDDTQEILGSIKDNRVRYIRHNRNRGQAAARNTGIRASIGKYIAFQDSDDQWLPEKLMKQITFFEKTSAALGVVYTGFWRVRNGEKTYIPSKKIKEKEGNINKQILRGNFIGTPVTVIKKEYLKKTGLFDETLPCLEDWEFFIRLSEHCEFKYVPEALVISHATPNSVSSKQVAHMEAKKYILEKHYEEISKDKYILALHNYSIGSSLCEIGQITEGRKWLFRAWKLDPLCIRFTVALILSFLGKTMYAKGQMIKRRIFG